LLEIPVLYLSRHIIRNKQTYHDFLLAVTAEASWEPWILFMLDADQNLKIYSRELAEAISVNPYCRISDLVSAGIAQRQAASTYLKTLASLNLLEELKGGRGNLYINPALLALLSDRNTA
jgi:Fic family protein